MRPRGLALPVIPKRPFGSTGVEVAVLGQGTWQLRDRRAAAEALREGVDLGMTHVDSGKTRFVGVSNFDVEEMEEAKSALGKHRLACNQVLYHLEERGVESDVLPWCKRNGLALVGYSPFGSTNGFPSPRSEGGKAL